MPLWGTPACQRTSVHVPSPEVNLIERSTHSHRLLLLIAYLGFISLGLPDTLIGVAWPSVRDTFHLQQSAIAFIFFGTGLSYFLSSFFTGRLLSLLGVGVLLAASSLLVVVSGFGYALAPVWALFAVCSILHGLGSGAIDAGLNHYVAHHFSARHMNWLHACYSLGATFGPLIMTAMLAGYGSWRAGYFTVASILLLLSILFAFTRRKWDEPERAADAESVTAATMTEALRHPVVWLQIVLFFVYTGLEVTVGQWSFTLLTESRSIAKETAGLWVTVYWASIGIGRLLFGFVVDRLGIDRLLRLSMIAAMLGTTLFVLDISGFVTVISLALTGLGLAAIYPCMMTRTSQRLGKTLAAHAIGFQVSAAMLGAAALPSLAGFLAQLFRAEAIATAAVGMAVTLYLLHEGILLRGPRRQVV